MYPGQVKHCDQNGTKVSVLHRLGSSNWIWPKHEDSIYYSRNELVRKIAHPRKGKRGGFVVWELPWSPQVFISYKYCIVLSITADVFQIAHQQGFKIHGYADDLQLYQHCLPTDVDMMKDCFSMCVEKIMVWMSSNRFRLNASKTEILWLGSSRWLAETALPSSIVIDNCSVPLADEVKCLGLTIDSALTFSKHVSSLVRTCYFQLRQLRSIRKSLTVDTCHALVRSLIISRLDYCNGILTSAPADLHNWLDGVLRGADFETSAFWWGALMAACSWSPLHLLWYLFTRQD